MTTQIATDFQAFATKEIGNVNSAVQQGVALLTALVKSANGDTQTEVPTIENDAAQLVVSEIPEPWQGELGPIIMGFVSGAEAKVNPTLDTGLTTAATWTIAKLNAVGQTLQLP